MAYFEENGKEEELSLQEIVGAGVKAAIGLGLLTLIGGLSVKVLIGYSDYKDSINVGKRHETDLNMDLQSSSQGRIRHIYSSSYPSIEKLA